MEMNKKLKKYTNEITEKNKHREFGVKYDDDKPRWELLPFREIKDIVDVLTHGAKQYREDNWKFVEPKSRYIGALFRHVYFWLIGEKYDLESGKNHLAHAICCLLFLLWDDNEKKNKK